MSTHQNGKGSKPRPTNIRIYCSNYDDIFRKKTVKDKKTDKPK